MPELPSDEVIGDELPPGEVRVSMGEGDFLCRNQARGQDFLSNEPVASGGSDKGPTPYELLLAALGSCTSMTMRMYARRKRIELTGLEVMLKHSREHHESPPLRLNNFGSAAVQHQQRGALFALLLCESGIKVMFCGITLALKARLIQFYGPYIVVLGAYVINMALCALSTRSHRREFFIGRRLMPKTEVRPTTRLTWIAFAILKHKAESCLSVGKNYFAATNIANISWWSVTVLRIDTRDTELLDHQRTFWPFPCFHKRTI